MSRPSLLLRLFAAIVLFCSISLSAFAGEQSGKITRLWVRSSDGLHYFILEGTGTNKPACARNSYWMIRDENSQSGRDQFAMLLSAFASGQRINVSGRNTCLRWGDGEDVESIEFVN